jgi:hypothetical protein
MKQALAVAVLLAACGGDDAGGATIDAAVDGTSATLLGAWVRVPVVGPDGVERVTFSAGARWAAEGTFGNASGTYLLDGGTWLTIQGGVGWQYEGDILLAGDQLMIQPYLPVGSPAGIVGTWVADYATNALVSERLVVEAAGAASITTTIRGTPTTVTGTWTEEPGGFVVDAGAAPGSPFHFRTMGGAAVGTQLFERAP